MPAANPLRLLWLPGITSSTGARSATLDRYLSRRTITVNRPTEAGVLTVYVGNPRRTIEYFSHEADRFASASFESLMSESVQADYQRSTAWSLIRGYYSAFFALHALMRLRGWACTRFTSAVVGAINSELTTLFPDADRIEGGLYFLDVQGNGAELMLERLDASTGGTHEALWSMLTRYATELSDRALTDSADPESGASLALAIGEFTDAVRGLGGPMYFTQVRNRLNYAHAYGAWYPYSNSTSDAPRISLALSRWLLTPEAAIADLANDELVRFAQLCAFVVSLCRTTIEDLSYRSLAQSPFRFSSGRLATQARRT